MKTRRGIGLLAGLAALICCVLQAGCGACHPRSILVRNDSRWSGHVVVVPHGPRSLLVTPAHRWYRLYVPRGMEMDLAVGERWEVFPWYSSDGASVRLGDTREDAKEGAASRWVVPCGKRMGLRLSGGATIGEVRVERLVDEEWVEAERVQVGGVAR